MNNVLAEEVFLELVQLDDKLIFVVEDDFDIAQLIEFNLVAEGAKVKLFSEGLSLLKALNDSNPDFIILDIMLPGMDGVEVCRKVKRREKSSNVPVVMVTAKGTEEDIVRGLEAGADDYVTKPFSPSVLVARVKAVLRRIELVGRSKNSEDQGVIELNQLYIHPGRHEVRVGQERVELTHSEFQILLLLANKVGWVFTRSQIVDAIHGMNYAVTDRTIDFQMVGLRKKLGSEGVNIETVRGVGYRYKEA